MKQKPKLLHLLTGFFILFLMSGCGPQEKKETSKPNKTEKHTEQSIKTENTTVKLSTNYGEIEVELFPAQAPVTVKNFLAYVNSQFYENTIFHRVIPGFMIQGGGFTTDMTKKTTQPPIKNEATNKLGNKRGTIAMARTSNPNSATSQFFINVIDNNFLNKKPGNAGYAVFGRVIKGMEVIDDIAGVKTTQKKHMNDVPIEPVVIESASILSE